MAADLDFNGLLSRGVRRSIGNGGIRKFNPSLNQAQQQKQGGILGAITSFITKGFSFLGWLIGGIAKLLFGAIGFSITAIWTMFTQTVQFIWNFDWNITDKAIDAQIEGSYTTLAGLAGGTLGGSLGWLFCGVLPGAIVFSFNEALGAYILKNVTEEAAEEIAAQLGNLVQQTFRSGLQNLALWAFKNVRRLLKTKGQGLIKRLFGPKTGAKIIKSWGEEGSQPWSFAQKFDDAIEKIPNKYLREFIEEGFEEFMDACVEAGYVVANTADSWIAAQALLKENQTLGKDRFVEIQPNRSIEDERIILAGPEKALKPVIVQTLSNYQLMEKRDIGTFVGQPVDDYLRAKPQSIRLVITFFSKQYPPYAGSQTEACYAVPDVKPTKCDWETIKLACGGANGYNWGRFRVTANLDNGRQMAIYGASHNEAEERLKALAALSSANILGKVSYGEDRREDKSGVYLKRATRVYPAYFTILNQYRVPGALGSGVPLLDGRHKRRKERIELWPDEKPPGTDALILELLKKPGAEEENS